MVMTATITLLPTACQTPVKLVKNCSVSSESSAGHQLLGQALTLLRVLKALMLIR